jgi:hypothetical protein
MSTASPTVLDAAPAVLSLRNSSQLAYLLATVWAQPARELVERLAAETRRP